MKPVKYNIAVSLIPSSETKFSFLNEAKFIHDQYWAVLTHNISNPLLGGHDDHT